MLLPACNIWWASSAAHITHTPQLTGDADHQNTQITFTSFYQSTFLSKCVESNSSFTWVSYCFTFHTCSVISSMNKQRRKNQNLVSLQLEKEHQEKCNRENALKLSFKEEGGSWELNEDTGMLTENWRKTLSEVNTRAKPSTYSTSTDCFGNITFLVFVLTSGIHSGLEQMKCRFTH